MAELPLEEIRHDPKFEKIGPAAILKNIGDRLASLLYGDGKTLGTTPNGIRGEAQVLVIGKHKLKERRFVVRLKNSWLAEEENPRTGRHQTLSSSLDIKGLHRAILAMVSHAAKNGVHVVVVVGE